MMELDAEHRAIMLTVTLIDTANRSAWFWAGWVEGALATRDHVRDVSVRVVQDETQP